MTATNPKQKLGLTSGTQLETNPILVWTVKIEQQNLNEEFEWQNFTRKNLAGQNKWQKFELQKTVFVGGAFNTELI